MMINMNVIYIFILAIRIYNINPFVGICIGCEYAYTVLNIACFETFSEKHEENELHRKRTLFLVLQQTYLMLQFH